MVLSAIFIVVIPPVWILSVVIAESAISAFVINPGAKLAAVRVPSGIFVVVNAFCASLSAVIVPFCI
jgi:hypothetical protein